MKRIKPSDPCGIMSELIDVVDPSDNVIGKAAREEVHNSDAWHRGVHLFIFNSSGKLFLPLRSQTKDKFPSTYDCSVSEHVNAGETFEDAARRGANEELGIPDAKLVKKLKFRMNYGPNDSMISVLYECRHDDDILIDEDETQDVRLLSLNEIGDMLAENETEFAPWSRELMKWYLGLASMIEEIV